MGASKLARAGKERKLLEISQRSIQASSDHPLDPFLLEHCRHMLYVTQRDQRIKIVGQELVQSTIAYIEEYGASIMEIGVLPKANIFGKHPKAKDSFDNLCTLLRMNPSHTDVVHCFQASPHVDEMFRGEAFLSAVLSTGNEAGYYVGCISEPANRCGSKLNPQPVRTNLHVQTGDVFLLNPQHIHFAMPLEFTPESMLILLQESIDDASPEDRQAIYARCPPAKALESGGDLSQFHFG